MGGRRWVSKLDMYKKVPIDMLEGSKQGSLISWLALLAMAVLFCTETADYLTTRITSDLMLDRHHKRAMIDEEELIRASCKCSGDESKCRQIPLFGLIFQFL